MDKEKIEFFDTNFWMGEHNLSDKYSVNDIAALEAISAMKAKYNITGAFINHFNSYFCSPEAGNDILAGFLQKIKTSAPSVSCYGVLFMEFDYFKGPGIFSEQLKKRYNQGFRAVRLLPKSHKYPFEATLAKHIYEVLNECRFPVIINLEELDITGDKYIEWMKILHVASSFPEMPLIIDGGNSKEIMFNSYIYLLIRNSSNIYFNTHNLFSLRQIENIAEFGGSGRLVFDSYFPFYETFLSVDRILEADLSEADKANISSANIKNIISNIKI